MRARSGRAAPASPPRRAGCATASSPASSSCPTRSGPLPGRPDPRRRRVRPVRGQRARDPPLDGERRDHHRPHGALRVRAADRLGHDHLGPAGGEHGRRARRRPRVGPVAGAVPREQPRPLPDRPAPPAGPPPLQAPRREPSRPQSPWPSPPSGGRTPTIATASAPSSALIRRAAVRATSSVSPPRSGSDARAAASRAANAAFSAGPAGARRARRSRRGLPRAPAATAAVTARTSRHATAPATDGRTTTTYGNGCRRRRSTGLPIYGRGARIRRGNAPAPGAQPHSGGASPSSSW